MQPSDQQLPGESVEQSSEDKIEPATQPLYEFPGDELLPSTGPTINRAPTINRGATTPAPITRVLPDEELAHMPLEEAVQRGLIYPPPPTFYQNMQEVPVQRPLPPQYEVNERTAPRFGSVQAPPFTPPTTPARRSRTWIWIVVSILSLAFLASCGICIWAAYAYLSPVAQQLSGAIDVADDYYSNIQAQHYATAYLDLALNGQNRLTQDQFVQLAQTRDAQDGRVRSYILGQPAYNSNPTSGLDLSHLTITVNVTRCKGGASSGQSCLSYTTLLTMQKVAGHWKIVDFYKI
jgi:hypothetical protein